MRRRKFIKLMGGGAAAWPLAARAEQPNRIRRVAVLVGNAENDPETQVRVNALESGLLALGWAKGRNIQLEYRWAPGGQADLRNGAAELVAGAPDLLVASGTSVLLIAREATQSIPIVFMLVSDPEGAGFVTSLARPGGNLTGFTNFEPSITGKWLGILKEVAPYVTRVGILRYRDMLPRFPAMFDTLAPSLGFEPVEIDISSIDELERAVDALAKRSNVGLIVLPDPAFSSQRRLIVELAARDHIPAIYPISAFARDGGLLSYGVNQADQFRQAASYVDRILKGEKPANLPVQAPTKFELTVNLKTARALGLTVPPTLLAQADEVIE
jgi:putative ABC transport system substrate-binding protein